MNLPFKRSSVSYIKGSFVILLQYNNISRQLQCWSSAHTEINKQQTAETITINNVPTESMTHSF